MHDLTPALHCCGSADKRRAAPVAAHLEWVNPANVPARLQLSGIGPRSCASHGDCIATSCTPISCKLMTAAA